MRNGEKIWFCHRISLDNAETVKYSEPIEERLRLPSVFSPISITVQPKNGFTDRYPYGETTIKEQRIILTPYRYWVDKFKEGDKFYLDGAKPTAEERFNGDFANYQVDNVANQNEGIELSVKKII